MVTFCATSQYISFTVHAMTFSKRNLNSHYQRGVGLWVWVLRIVGARADGVLGRLLLVATTGPQTTPAR